MKIMVVGQGGREHALVTALKESPGGHELYAWPGNDAMTPAALRPRLADQAELVDWMGREGIDLCVVGEEKYLAAGLADACAERGMRVWGPGREAARLESSKRFAKEFMQRHGVPTGGYTVVEDEAALRAAVPSLPAVLKYDGLAAGKGVSVCVEPAQVDEFCARVFGDRQFGEDPVVVEEFLTGPEVSVICAVADGRYRMFPRARDYKRLLDGDGGPNTGGMGAVASKHILPAEVTERIEREIVQPAVAGLVADGLGYRGFLYFGVMLTPEGPRMLEFNCRFGDPEAQAVLPLLEGDFAQYLYDAAGGELRDELLRVADGWSVCLVMATRDYPLRSGAGDVISGLDQVRRARVYHAGTRRNPDGEFETAGGRVLAVVDRGTTREEAVANAYEELARVAFDGARIRTDIGSFNF